MQIDEKLLQKLEKLSSLKIAEDKRNQVLNDLSDVLNFVQNLNEINTENIVQNKQNFTPLREDEVSNSCVIECILEHAPASKDHYFSVPKIIE